MRLERAVAAPSDYSTTTYQPLGQVFTLHGVPVA